MAEEEEGNLEWTKQHTTYFIELLENYPCLWRVKCSEYKNKQLRASAVKEMCAGLANKMNCSIKGEHIMKKLHTLRSQYRKEMKAVRASQKSGAATEDVYVPKLWCFDLLKFLDEGDVIRQSTSNLDEKELDQVIYIFCFVLHSY